MDWNHCCVYGRSSVVADNQIHVIFIFLVGSSDFRPLRQSSCFVVGCRLLELVGCWSVVGLALNGGIIGAIRERTTIKMANFGNSL